MKFHMTVFGCQMNVHDADWLAGALESRGLKRTADESEADAFLLLTCSVREKPEQKVYSELGRLAAFCAARPGAFAAVGGCVAQQAGRSLMSRFPFVRLVFGTDGAAQAPEAVSRLLDDPALRLAFLDMLPDYVERDEPQAQSGPAQAFVNIMQGCDNYCAYCIVPFVRGRQRSRHPDRILDEVRGLAGRGVREITLLGQNVNSFGQDKGGAGVGFAGLLRCVAAVPGVERLRFTTSHPKDLAGDVVAAYGELDNLCPHLHLPLQSGSDTVLSRMGRRYDAAGYRRIVADLRRARPDLALTTDLIVGFPGETEEDFQRTLELVEEIGFEQSYSFAYTDRPGAAACRMTPKVSRELALERLSRLQNVQNGITLKRLQEQVGRTTVVLFEGPSRRQEDGVSFWRGRDPGSRTVNVPFAGDLSGRMLRVALTEAKKHSLAGEGRGEPW